MEAFIHFIITYNEKIIYIATALICILSAIVVWWQVFGRHGLNTGDQPEVDLSAIEASLKKILEQTNTAIHNVSTVGSAGGGAKDSAAVAGVIGKIEGLTTLEGQPIADLPGVKNELEARAGLIKELQQKVKNAKSEATPELLARIKELEAKLAEYEIIEDDIADLSHFKEENAKLQKELEMLKRADPKMVDQFAEAIKEEASADSMESVGSADVQELTATLEAEAQQSEPVGVAPVMDAIDELTSETIQGNALSAQLEAISAPEEVEIPKEIVSLASVSPESKSPVSEATQAVGDIFGEFTKDEKSEADPLAELGEIDPDRMLDELKGLNADMNLGAETLDEAPDMDKMADEVTGLPKKG